MKPTILGIVIVLALLAAGAIFYGGSALAPLPQAVVEQSYTNDLYGISFAYPAGYVLTEGEVGTAERRHYFISIVRDEDAAPRENSEGPAAISFDIYQNDNDKQTLAHWLTSSNESNLKLGDGSYASTTVDTAEAARYSWSGLYQGETTAFLHKNNIVAVSVTYDAPSDEIRTAYAQVLASLHLHE